MKNILIVSGEASGDIHAGDVMMYLNKLDQNIKFFGIGGKCSIENNIDLLHNISETAVVGFFEVIKKLFSLKKIFSNVIKVSKEKKPAFAILIDYPAFNLRLAKRLKKLGIPVIWYIAPQVWAWKESRVIKMKEYISDLIVIFSFEVAFFKTHNIETKYFGHPLQKKIADYKTTHPNLKKDTKKTIAYFPGSRKNEVKKHLPILIKLINTLGDKYYHIISVSDNIEISEITKYQNVSNFNVSEDNYDLLNNSDFAIIKSGTTTIEATLFSLPFCVIYKTSKLSYLIAKLFSKIKFIAMPNILTNSYVVNEFIQSNMTVDNLKKQVSKFLNDDFRIETIYKLNKIFPKSEINTPKLIAKFIFDKYLI
ncbi:MAG: lipid-A-disaccharide synthase [Candidatus Kapaibacterium sp.]